MTGMAPINIMRRLRAGALQVFTVSAAAIALTITAAPATSAQANMASVTPRTKPPAPGPTYMSRADKDRLLAVSTALKAKQFSTAKSYIALVSDPIAKSLGQWMYLMAKDPTVDFNEADAFLDSNPDWPAQNRIHAFIEDRIPNSAPADQVLAFFDTRPPETGEGKIQLARALFSVGDKFGGERYIRDAWINDNFKLAEERRILSVYGHRLTKADHAARVDRLLWSRQVTNARRVFSQLDSKERKKAEARAALLLQASSAQRLYDGLPEDAKLDSGMLHAAVRYHRRRGEEQYAMALAALGPKDPQAIRNGGRWWDERNLLMRWALKNGRFADAYKVAAEHGLSEGADFAEAEFYAGWIALRFLDAPERAETHFLALASEVGSPISVSRANYWLGRALAAQGDMVTANMYYAKAARFYYSYYGQLAAEKLGGEYENAVFSPEVQSTPAERALFASRPTVAALRMLTDLNLDYEIMVFAYHVDGQLERPGEYIELAKLTDGEGAPHLTVRAGKVAIQRNAFTPQVAYPLIYVPEEASRFVSPEIVLGLSRQESEFNPRAYSRAGARGVMQLIPTTAQITARKEGLPYSRTALLDDPLYNMMIGSAHLSHLLDRYDGSMIMTLAAYNAGPTRVSQWMTDYGDPRNDAVDPLDWVELIPFSETRNYVQRVLENVQVYRGRLNDRPIPGRLRADLERGGARNRIASDAPPSVVLASLATRYGAQDLAPAPERTVERARRYAQQNPPRPPEAAGAPLAAPQEPVTGASPIAFAPAQTTEQLASTEPGSAPQQKLQQPQNKPLPIIIPQGGEELRADISVAADEADAPAPSTPSPAMAERDAPPIANTKINVTRDDVILTPQPVMAEPEPVIGEEMADNIDDFSGVEDSMDACLTYRDFLARNAEEDAEASDLNAAMLAELSGGGPACE